MAAEVSKTLTRQKGSYLNSVGCNDVLRESMVALQLEGKHFLLKPMSLVWCAAFV